MIHIARILELEREYLYFMQSDVRYLMPLVSNEQQQFNESPFLLHKHLERDFLVFSLVSYSKNNMDEEDLMNEED